ILLMSTVCPRCRSGAVGSNPAFTCKGRPRASLLSSSASSRISAAPRRRTCIWSCTEVTIFHSVPRLGSLTHPTSHATVTRVFDPGEQALGQPENQIRLDYRSEDKPATGRTRPQLRWLASAILTPLAGGLLLLMGSGHTPATSNASLLSTGLETHPLALPP